MIDTNELRRKVNSTDIVDHIDLHANIKPFLSELIDRLEAAEKERDNANAAAIGIALEAENLQDRLEAAEKAVTESYQRGYETGQEEIEKERDAAELMSLALRAKIAEMERQEPVAFALYSGGAFKAAYHKEHEACDQRDRRQLSADLGGSLEAYRVVPLYALPSAQSAPSVPEGWQLVPTAESRHPGIYKMLGALHDADNTPGMSEWESYRAMLAAAPEAKP